MFDKKRKKFSAYVIKKANSLSLKYKRLRYAFLYKGFSRKQTFKVTTIARARKKAFAYFTFFFIAVSYALAVAVLPYTLTVDVNIADFIFGSAAMIGGTLAIVFTFHTLIVNFALDQYPSEFYKLTGYERKLDVVYVLLAICTILQFLIGTVYVAQDVWVRALQTLLSIFILCGSIYILYYAMRLVRTRLDPLNGLGLIRDSGRKILRAAQNFGNKYHKLLLKNPDVEADKKKLLPYQSYIQLSSSWQGISTLLKYLHRLQQRAVVRNDAGSALVSMDIYKEILVSYLSINRDSLLPLQTPGNILQITTMAEPVMNPAFETLLDIGGKYIKAKDTEGVRKIVEVWRAISEETANLNFNNLVSENPEFSRSVTYYGMFLNEAIENNDTNALFEVITNYVSFGILCLTKNQSAQLGGVFDKIASVQRVAVNKKEHILHHQVAWAISSIFSAAIDQRKFDVYTANQLKESLVKATLQFIASEPDSVAAATVEAYLTNPLSQLAQVAFDLVPKANNFANNGRLDVQEKIIDYLNIVYEIIYKIISQGVVGNRVIALEYIRLTEAIIQGLVEISELRPWSSNKQQLTRIAKKFSQLGGFYTNNLVYVSNNKFNDAIQSSCRIAILSIQAGMTPVAEGAIESVELLANYLVAFSDTALWDAPRALSPLGLVALVALSRQEHGIVKKIKIAINEFNKAYIRKIYPNGLSSYPKEMLSSLPYPDQVRYEIKQSFKKLDTYSGFHLAERLEEIVSEIGVSIYFRAATLKYLKKKD